MAAVIYELAAILHHNFHLHLQVTQFEHIVGTPIITTSENRKKYV